MLEFHQFFKIITGIFLDLKRSAFSFQEGFNF